ncbi:uncharacterized protein P174DRAFT_379746, partial [Aspergillus novofumigatus IBT 16806]
AELIRSTRKVPIVLDSPDDWWNWDSHIKGIAMSYGVKEILLGETPRPLKPIHPDDSENTQANQSYDCQVNSWKR